MFGVHKYAFDHMRKTAAAIKGQNVTVGLLTPGHRFVADESVPNNTRYHMPQQVLDFEPGASKQQMEAVLRSRQSLANKRARISK